MKREHPASKKHVPVPLRPILGNSFPEKWRKETENNRQFQTDLENGCETVVR